MMPKLLLLTGLLFALALSGCARREGTELSSTGGEKDKPVDVNIHRPPKDAGVSERPKAANGGTKAKPPIKGETKGDTRSAKPPVGVSGPAMGPETTKGEAKRGDRTPASAKGQKSQPTIDGNAAVTSEDDTAANELKQIADSDRLVSQLSSANIAFNAPKTMNRNDTVMIQLLLSLTKKIDELSQSITAPGTKEGAEIKVASVMEARLTGTNFQITAIGEEEKRISGVENTEWKWEVKPLAIGQQNLHLSLTAKLSKSKDTIWYRTFDQTIKVEVTTAQQVADFIGHNWQWLWAVVVVPVAAGIWKKRSKTEKDLDV